MRTTLDFSPLFKSSIGFDRVFDLLDSMGSVEPFDNWPPYDIMKTGEDGYRISMSVAGFSPDELEVTHEGDMLVVKGAKKADGEVEYLHKGIANRSFIRRFELADFVYVANAALADGLLVIDLKRELPEEMKPKRIEIHTGEALPGSGMKQIEAKAA